MMSKKAQYLLLILVSICLFFQVSTIYSNNIKKNNINNNIDKLERFESVMLNDFKGLKYFNELMIFKDNQSINVLTNINNHNSKIEDGWKTAAVYYPFNNSVVLIDNFDDFRLENKLLIILHEYSHHLMKKEHLSFKLTDSSYNNEIVTDIIAYSIFKYIYDFEYSGEIGYLANKKLINSLDIDIKELEKLNEYLEKEWNNTFKF